jgi:hypothetical protein
MQSGLTAKWKRDSKFYFQLESRLKHTDDRYRAGKVRINLKHLEMAFLSLSVGYVISSVVFIIEVLRKKAKINSNARVAVIIDKNAKTTKKYVNVGSVNA